MFAARLVKTTPLQRISASQIRRHLTREPAVWEVNEVDLLPVGLVQSPSPIFCHFNGAAWLGEVEAVRVVVASPEQTPSSNSAFFVCAPRRQVPSDCPDLSCLLQPQGFAHRAPHVCNLHAASTSSSALTVVVVVVAVVVVIVVVVVDVSEVQVF